MSEALTQHDYWNRERSKVQGNYGVPLVPSEPEVEFMQKHIVAGGDTLVLGTTRRLCGLALEASRSVVSVDYSENMIEGTKLDGVQYACDEWSHYLRTTTDQYDTILTDGGLNCLDFSRSWQNIAGHIYERLRSDGTFAARIYLSTNELPKSNYENPGLNRFVPDMARVNESWMVQPHDDVYRTYNVQYAFPPEHVVLRTFGRLALCDKLVPDYEEGERFVSFAWQRR